MEKQKISKKENDNSLKNGENSVWKDNDVLANVIKEIEKDFGKGSVMLLDGNSAIKTESISSGSFLIDKAIGISGYPKGRIIEIYGPESSGKTTLALHAIAQAQLANGVAAFIDAEHSLDPKYAKNLGVNIESLIVSQPDYGEQALDILESLVKSNVVDIVVVDSVAALVPKAELEGEMGDQSIGLQARLMSKALRKLNGIISKTNTVVIFINQLREKVGVMFGNPEVTSGGKALKFFSSLRLEVRRGEQIIANGEIIGNKAKIKVVKNKVAPPFKIAQVSILYNKGIDKLEEIIDMGVLYNVLTKSGVWYSYKDQKIGQGKTSVIEWFNKDEQNLELVRKEIEEIIDSSYNDK